MTVFHVWHRTMSGILVTCMLFSGCVRLKGNNVYEYVPSLPKGKVPARVTMEEFQDMRSEKDKKHTRDVEPVAPKVTRKLFDDFKQSEVFDNVLSGDIESDLVIKGRIYTFYWKNRYQWYVFVPYLNLIILFGVPAGRMIGEVKLAIDIVDKKSGTIIATYEEHAKKEDTYTGYRTFWGMTVGSETSESFRVVAERLKDRILADKDRIVARTPIAA